MRPEDPPVVGMLRAGSVRQCFGGAAAHLFSAVISVGGSLVEDLGRHSWLEAARGLPACWTDILSNQPKTHKSDGHHLEQVQLEHCQQHALVTATYLAFCWISAAA